MHHRLAGLMRQLCNYGVESVMIQIEGGQASTKTIRRDHITAIQVTGQQEAVNNIQTHFLEIFDSFREYITHRRRYPQHYCAAVCVSLLRGVFKQYIWRSNQPWKFIHWLNGCITFRCMQPPRIIIALNLYVTERYNGFLNSILPTITFIPHIKEKLERLGAQELHVHYSNQQLEIMIDEIAVKLSGVDYILLTRDDKDTSCHLDVLPKPWYEVISQLRPVFYEMLEKHQGNFHGILSIFHDNRESHIYSFGQHKRDFHLVIN